MGVARDLLVVVAHQRDILGHLEAELGQRLHRAQRHQVVGAEDGGGRARLAHQRQRRLEAGARHPVAVAHQRRVEGQVGGGQRAAVALEPVLGGLHPGLAVDEADAGVAHRDQMLGGRMAAADLAGHDGGQAVALVMAVQQHHRQLGVVGQHRRQRHLPGEDGRVDDAQQHRVGAQCRDRRGLLVGIAAGDDDADQAVVLPGRVARAVDADHRMRAGRDLVDQIADQAAPQPRCRAGAGDRLGGGLLAPRQPVAQLHRHAEHAAARLGRQPRAGHVVEHHRHGGLGHAGGLGHIGHGGAAHGHRGRLAGGHGSSVERSTGRPRW